MRIKQFRFVNGLFVFTFLTALISCAADKTPLSIDSSLPKATLAYYSDSFETMREDLWDRDALLFRKEQVQNFKLADMHVTNGKLIIRTKPGSFSKGGLGSRYALRGDFDVQLNCRINFREGVSGMDQLFTFSVFDATRHKGKRNIVGIGVYQTGGINQSFLFNNYLVNSRTIGGDSQEIENFNGWFRIMRTGQYVSAFFRKERQIEWTKMNTYPVANHHMLVSFQLRNFFFKRTRIRADYSISAEIDHFKLNAAWEIIEEEI